MSGKGCKVNTGELSGETPRKLGPAEVRAAVVAEKSGNADGAKGGRKADASSLIEQEERAALVSEKNKQAEEDLWQRHKAEPGVWSEKMLMALETGIKGKVWFSLIDKVYSERTLQRAWEKVRTNAGGSGVDHITIERFRKDSQSRLLAVREQLKRGDYQPKPVKRVWIPKAGSKEERPLGIPVVTDRVVQCAIKMVIEPIFEREFARHSYGFRPGRGCKNALRQVDEGLKRGALHVVDVDIKGYFDSIPHEGLLTLLKEHIADRRVLSLIESYLKQGVMEKHGDVAQAGEEGTPQGAVLSPLLANVYLNPLDKLMEAMGLTMIRYADDMVILCSTKDQAQQALERLEQWCDQAGLTLHPEKTKIVDMGEPGTSFDFLGYRFRRNYGKRRLTRLIRPKSLKQIKERIKPLTRRANGRSLEQILSKVNPILKGVNAYFMHASESQLEKLDAWVRGRLRGILRKRHGGEGRGHGKDHFKWPNHYFEEEGLYSLLQARALKIISLQNGEHC